MLVSAFGGLSLGLGLVGVFLPLLPTTPFVLLAAVCFSYSNHRFYEWIRRAPFFGEFIANYEEKRGVAMPLKIKSIVLVWLSLAVSMFLIQTLWAYVLLGLIGTGVTIHLLMLKTKK